MRILAVDDDDIALDLLGNALRGAGYTDLETATSGAEAMDIICKTDRPFDVFLLDIRMPGMDGIELCERIRNMDRYRRSPVVMITAMSERHFIDGAFAAGAIDYISKPFDPVELGVRIRIAARLVDQAREVAKGQSEVDFLKSRSGLGNSFAAGDAIEIHDIPRVISQTAMENYLLRLNLRMAYQTKSVAFSIAGFEALHARTKASDVYDLLTDVAASIIYGLKHTQHLVTYCGNGGFVAVVHGRNSVVDDDTILTIQAVLDELEPTLSNGRPCPLTLGMGKVYVPGLLAASERLNLLIKPQDKAHTTLTDLRRAA
ncbi:MAG: response regulator [Rhodobacteraceae bacterium]|nr:response regulator [Paracoccaceae bacterium]